MNTTDNYGLNLPETSDYADIAKLNENFQKLDDQALAVQAAKTALADADKLPLVDSADSKTKLVSWSNIKAALGELFAGITHASRHKIGGADELAAADIGAVAQDDKATEEEAVAGTDDTKYMTSAKVWSQIVGKGCSRDDILYWVLLAMSPTSGKSISISDYVYSGTIGLSTAVQTESVYTMTISLGSLSADALIALIGTPTLLQGTSSSSGLYTSTTEIEITVNGVTIQIGTTTAHTGASILSALVTAITGLNLVSLFGEWLTNSDTVVLTVTTTRASGTGYDYCIPSGSILLRYLETA